MHAKRASSRRAASTWVAPVLVCLIAFGLRLGPLWANRFHSDEALYASWALAVSTARDVLLAQVAPDKPPLLFYLMAAAFLVIGRVEVAARLIGLMAGVLSVALMWKLADRLALPPLISAIAFALSPFAILFAPTAFLDPTMVMLVLASLVAVTHGRPGWAGVLLGLGAATKVQALIYLPLVFVCSLFAVRHAQRSFVIGRFVAGLAMPLLAVLAWDRLRGGTPFWIQQTINYGGIRLIYASEVMPRLIGWASFLPYFFGWPMLIALSVGLPLLLIYDLTRNAHTNSALLDLALIAFSLGYFFLHWLLAFQVWDRYIFGLMPIVCLLIGRLASRMIEWLTHRIGKQSVAGCVTALLIVVMMGSSASEAWQSAIPVGGDHGPHDGIDRVASYLQDFPYGTVVYDHWLGWTLRYYLWDARTYIAYFATPQSLAEDLHVFGRTSPRFIVIPANESTTRIERAMALEGFTLSPVLATQDRHGQPTFTLYRIDAYASR